MDFILRSQPADEIYMRALDMRVPWKRSKPTVWVENRGKGPVRKKFVVDVVFAFEKNVKSTFVEK